MLNNLKLTTKYLSNKQINAFLDDFGNVILKGSKKGVYVYVKKCKLYV